MLTRTVLTDNCYLFLWTGLRCQVRLNQASTDLRNSMLHLTFLLIIYNSITRTSIYLRIVYTFIVICAINNQLILFITLLFYSCTCKLRHHYTCKILQFHFYANHHCVCNLLIYVFFIVYIIIKINPIHIIICNDPARCLQLIKWVSYMNIISKPCHQSRISILFIKIISILSI